MTDDVAEAVEIIDRAYDERTDPPVSSGDEHPGAADD